MKAYLDKILDLERMPPARPTFSPVGGPPPGMVLVHPYLFRDLAGHEHYIQAGYRIDGASIPTVSGLTWAITHSPYDPRVLRAALVHDYLCDTRPPSCSSTQAARLFYQLLLREGVGSVKAWLMWQAVLRFGPRWRTT